MFASMANDKRVSFGPMVKLALDFTGPGVFSRERLVKFVDSSGAQQAALVDAGLVHEESGRYWLEVKGQIYTDGNALISMPTDGSRVIVPLTRVEGLQR
jgi:hypothetical protein